jgi:prephenate dehydratase
MKAVAIQGGPASYSEQAVHKLLGHSVRIYHHDTFDDALARYRRDTETGLLLPWWNRCIGAIGGVQALIEQVGLHHSAEIEIPVHHCLIGRPGCDDQTGGKVYSHPAALAQCRQFFRRYPRFAPHEDKDTADSVLRLKQDGDQTVFAIASASAAAYYSMEILETAIQDQADNITVFRCYPQQ